MTDGSLVLCVRRGPNGMTPHICPQPAPGLHVTAVSPAPTCIPKPFPGEALQLLLSTEGPTDYSQHPVSCGGLMRLIIIVHCRTDGC